MRILCTQSFHGDLRMLGSVIARAPRGMELLPLDRQLDKTRPFDGILTCHVGRVGMLRGLFPYKPIFLLPHNSAPVKKHYWLPEDLEAVDAVLTTGPTMAEKARSIDPNVRTIPVPYPRLAEYREVRRQLGERHLSEPRYDAVFACTAYRHYRELAGMDPGSAFWHRLVEEMAPTGLRLAVLRHGNDAPLREIEGVDYFDQPQPLVLFSGRWVITDFASNGLIAAALGQPTLQVIDQAGEVEPCFNSYRGLMPDLRLELGPRYGRDWSLEDLLAACSGAQDTFLAAAWQRMQPLARRHLNVHLEDSELYRQLAREVVRAGGGATEPALEVTKT